MNYKYKFTKYNYKINNLLGGSKKLKKINYTKSNKNINKVIMSNYTENISEPWFSLIVLGLKTVEGRKNKGRFKEMKIGDIIEWTNNDFISRKVLTKIIDKIEYKTFEDYLLSEGIENCLPGIPTLEHGLSVYFKYFSKEEESEFGVIALKIEKLTV
jgi:ASC-1-like (ASCH) protein